MRQFTKLFKSMESFISKGQLSYREVRVLVAINAKTIGFNKLAAQIPLTELANDTLIEYKNLSKTIKSLENKNIIIRNSAGIMINFDHIEWLVNEQNGELSTEGVKTTPSELSTEGVKTTPYNGVKTTPYNGVKTTPLGGCTPYYIIEKKENIIEMCNCVALCPDFFLFWEIYPDRRHKEVAHGEFRAGDFTTAEFNNMILWIEIEKILRKQQATEEGFNKYWPLPENFIKRKMWHEKHTELKSGKYICSEQNCINIATYSNFLKDYYCEHHFKIHSDEHSKRTTGENNNTNGNLQGGGENSIQSIYEILKVLKN